LTKKGFQKATKKQAKLRLGICGPAGSGKTYTALIVATALSDKVAFIDTERGSASKYSDEFDFDVLELDEFDPRNYIEAINMAEEAGYEVLVIDSLSHAWAGKGGVLEQVDNTAARMRTGNSFAAWREGSKLHNELVDTILQCNMHVIATMRSKMEYVQEKDERGKTVIRKVGMAPVQRDGMEYEFDVVGDMDQEHTLIITKTRCKVLKDAVIKEPDAKFAKTLQKWLTDGVPVEEQKTAKERLLDDVFEAAAERGLDREDAEFFLTKAFKVNSVKDLTTEQLKGSVDTFYRRTPEQIMQTLLKLKEGADY